MALFDSLLSGLFGDEVNPSEEANRYLSQIPGAMRGYLGPAYERGERAAGSLEGEYGRMAKSPQDLINEIMKGYAPSDAYKFQQQQLGQAAANTAAAGGMRGTPAEQAEQQRITQGLLSKDMQQWLSNVLGVKGAGLRGEESLYGTGAQAGTNLAESLANVLGSQGSMAFREALQRQQNQSNLLGNIFGGLGTVAGLGMPGGGTVGGALVKKFL